MAVTGLPRFPLATLPTPLARAERLERALGSPPLYVKRDDLTGFAFAGNKARKLELLVGAARAEGCDVLVTGGAASSSHCAATALAARVAGLDCVVVRPGGGSGDHPNATLTAVAGATTVGTGDEERASVDTAIAAVAVELRAGGRRPYAIPRGGATALGSAAFALAAGELAAQLAGAGVDPEVVLVPTGSCGTQAGLLAGAAAGGHGWRVVGAAVSRPVEESRRRVLDLACACAQLLGVAPPAPERVEVRDARGPGHGLPDEAAAAVARMAMECEGLVLDGAYTAKALAQLAALVAEGVRGPVVFWHTGGVVEALAGLVRCTPAGAAR